MMMIKEERSRLARMKRERAGIGYRDRNPRKSGGEEKKRKENKGIIGIVKITGREGEGGKIPEKKKEESQRFSDEREREMGREGISRNSAPEKKKKNKIK